MTIIFLASSVQFQRFDSISIVIFSIGASMVYCCTKVIKTYMLSSNRAHLLQPEFHKTDVYFLRL